MANVENTSEELLKRTFEKLFKEHYARLYYHALHIIPDVEVCKDLVSDTFHFVWENITTLRVETALTYMLTHLQRLCIDHIRRSDMKASHVPNYLATLREWNENHWRESEERIRIIMQLIEQMPPLTRQIMLQCYIYKKKYKEVAAMTGLSESGVRKHIMKGLDTIRQHFSVKYKKGGN